MKQEKKLKDFRRLEELVEIMERGKDEVKRRGKMKERGENKVAGEKSELGRFCKGGGSVKM